MVKSDAHKLIEQRHGFVADLNELEGGLATLLREQAADQDDEQLVSHLLSDGEPLISTTKLVRLYFYTTATV